MIKEINIAVKRVAGGIGWDIIEVRIKDSTWASFSLEEDIMEPLYSKFPKKGV